MIQQSMKPHEAIQGIRAQAPRSPKRSCSLPLPVLLSISSVLSLMLFMSSCKKPEMTVNPPPAPITATATPAPTPTETPAPAPTPSPTPVPTPQITRPPYTPPPTPIVTRTPFARAPQGAAPGAAPAGIAASGRAAEVERIIRGCAQRAGWRITRLQHAPGATIRVTGVAPNDNVANQRFIEEVQRSGVLRDIQNGPMRPFMDNQGRSMLECTIIIGWR